MRRIFIIILLFILISFLWLSVAPASIFAGYCGDGYCIGEDCNSCPADCGWCPPSPTPPAGYCGDGTCQNWLGEDPNSCPEDCGAPYGGDWCGEGTCPDGSSFYTYCSPSCDAVPRTCYDDPSCVEPLDCNIYGCPSQANCGTGVPVGCGVVICAPGGNCYSDCTNCYGPTPTPSPTGEIHKVCQAEACIEAAGSGMDVCSVDADCIETHNICQNEACIEAAGSGTDVCSVDTDCIGRYAVCQAEACVTVSGSGMDVCSVDADCIETHSICQNEACIEAAGSGTDVCSVDTDCIDVTPTPSPGGPNCECGPWQDVGCGMGTCEFWQMYKIQFCFWSDGSGLCYTGRRCVADPDCGQGPWFQTQEGDVHGQSIYVMVLEDEYFCKDGSGGSPGVVSHQEGADFSPGGVSSTGWLANTSFSSKNYNYFYQLLGSPTENLTSGDLSAIGDEVVYYAGDGKNLDITNGNFPGGKKAVILVNGNVDIDVGINVPVGSFLAIIASGNIEIASSVSQVEGIFIADGKFETKTGTTAFIGEGTFIADSFELNRNLGDDNETLPAETFVYRPDFWLNAPAELLIPSYTWEELAP